MLRFTALFLVGSLVAPSRGSCQTADPHAAQPERPTVATHAGTVAEGWLEIEAGGELDRYSDHSDGCGLPVTVKLGVASRLQFSLFASGILPQGGSGVHPGDVALGVKWRLSETLPFHGRFALLPSVKLPAGSPASGAGTGTTDVSLLFISSHELGPIELDINFSFTRRSGDGTVAPKAATLWTFSFGGAAIDPLGWVAELYGLPGTSGPAGKAASAAVLIGPTFTIRPWLVLDTGVIAPLVGPQPVALFLGGVWNIGQIWSTHDLP